MRAADSAVGETARTVLEQRIRERRLTFEEFAAFAEAFGREHGEAGTLSLRHLQRLVAGEGDSARLRPATARLLERIFDERIEILLSATAQPSPHSLRVAVAAVLRNDEVLVVSRREGTTGVPDSSWQFPAGMVKPGAQSREVAVAETFAETGVHCVHVRSLGTRLHPTTSVFCEYHLCEYIAGDAMNRDVAENAAVTWVKVGQLSRLIPVNAIFAPLRAELGLTREAASCSVWGGQARLWRRRDCAAAGGDSAQGSPAAGEQGGKAAFAEASDLPKQEL